MLGSARVLVLWGGIVAFAASAEAGPPPEGLSASDWAGIVSAHEQAA